MAEKIPDATDEKSDDTQKHSVIKDQRLKLDNTHQSCDPCRDEGNKETAASSFCVDCNDYLCIHKRSKHLRRHVLRDIDSLPTNNLSPREVLERYQKHQKESMNTDTCIIKSQSEKWNTKKQIRVATQVFPPLRKINSHPPNTTLREILRTTLSQNILFGCFISLPVDRIKVRMPYDEWTCYITGIEKLTDNKLIIADRGNSVLRLVDMTSGIVISEITGLCLWDLTKIDNKTIAVTNDDNKTIRIISVSDKLTVKQTIHQKDLGFSIGIVYLNKTLIVSYHKPDQIQILDLEGGVIRNIENKVKDGTVKFGKIGYIALSPNTNTLYLSDWTNHKIHCMTHDGEIISSFTHLDLNGPYGIAVSRDGRIFVCSYHVHKILEVSADLSKGRVLLRKWDGIKFPVSIMFDEEEHKLYVGSLNLKEIKVFLV